MTKRLILLLIVVSLPACHKEYRANENIENLSGSNAKFGGIVGIAYDCSNKPLPYAHLNLNKMPQGSSRKDFIDIEWGFYNDSFLVDAIADSQGNYAFKNVFPGSYQVMLHCYPLYPVDDTVDTSQPVPDSIKIKMGLDTSVSLYMDRIDPRLLQFNPCGTSGVIFVNVKPDSCSVLDIRQSNSLIEVLQYQPIWIEKYKPCVWNLDSIKKPR